MRPPGATGVVVTAPVDHQHAYRVRFPDGSESMLRRAEFTVLKHLQRDLADAAAHILDDYDRSECVILRCVVGSQAYGLARDDSDFDRRGVYLAPAEAHWSLFGVPEQLEDQSGDECYWELQKFLVLALKANPNVLECLYTPFVEFATPLARDLLDLRTAFLSKLIYQTYNGYVLSQFKKLAGDLRNKGRIKQKHAMHLIRLLLAGITALREAYVPVDAREHRDALLAIRDGRMPWEDVDRWRLALHREFDAAFAETRLPDRPDYARANELLVRARRLQAAAGRGGGLSPASTAGPLCPVGALRAPFAVDTRLLAQAGLPPAERFDAVIARQPYPLLFVTVSGAHLYGFASPDSDFDLRGVHLLPADDLLGLKAAADTIETSSDPASGLDVDLVTHDAAKFFRLLLTRNGYVLEQLYSPLVLWARPEHEELKAIARGCLTRHHAHHYLGFARTQWALFEKSLRVKALLYTYRVLLAGIHLMRSGEVESSLPRLAASGGAPAGLRELIQRKSAGREHAVIDQAEIENQRAEYERWTQRLEESRDQSDLPHEPSARGALSDLLVRLRRNAP